MKLSSTLLLALALGAEAACPFISSNGHLDGGNRNNDDNDDGGLPAGHPPVMIPQEVATAAPGYLDALAALDLTAVKRDLATLYTTSHPAWPSDYGNYGPFFVRLAWHCSGSYRSSDGRGGCDGGRQRFEPEQSWDDNTNLDKARALLRPIKEKYGLGLSWGDLFILAGTHAIEHMGGPTIGFCAGRFDDVDGSASAKLGPSSEQEAYVPCDVPGDCQSPLGSSTLGLIYLNPEGPMGKPDPVGSSQNVRDTFGRMSMNDTETVALIGGGHSFGKTHGACPDGVGPGPNVDPATPWKGKCGTGVGVDAFTRGFEGPWTATPTHWDNSYFIELLGNDWSVHEGPGGHFQWKATAPNASAPYPVGHGPSAPSADIGSTERQDIIMLTSDVSLLHDPVGQYQPIVEKFAAQPAALDHAFSHAWYKLTTRDMGPATRCHGDAVPPPQSWQNPLPPAPKRKDLADFSKVQAVVKELLASKHKNDASVFVRLAWNCASTFRATDYQGGCNGARVMQPPQKDWPANQGLDHTLDALQQVKHQFPKGLSWADLIVLAGQTALEHAGVPAMTFCGGRTDGELGGEQDRYLAPTLDGSAADTAAKLVDYRQRTALTMREMTALIGGCHSLGNMQDGAAFFVPPQVFSGSWTSNPRAVDNEYFTNLVTEQWKPYPVAKPTHFKAAGKEIYMLHTDMQFKFEPELAAIVSEYAGSGFDAKRTGNDIFLDDFAAAWTKLMNADRFDGMCTSTNSALQSPRPVQCHPSGHTDCEVAMRRCAEELCTQARGNVKSAQCWDTSPTVVCCVCADGSDLSAQVCASPPASQLLAEERR